MVLLQPDINKIADKEINMTNRQKNFCDSSFTASPIKRIKIQEDVIEINFLARRYSHVDSEYDFNYIRCS